MWKKLLAVLAMLYAFAAFAAVDVNKATAAELDAVKGIGPSISTRILDERKKGSFKDWNDFIERVKGVGEGNAAKFSAEGLTVNGSAFKGAAAPATPAAAKAAAKEEKKEEKVAAKDEKKDAKAEAKAKKEADKKAKADAKAAKAEAKKAAASAAKPTVAAAAAAAAAKPAASAASAAKPASAKK